MVQSQKPGLLALNQIALSIQPPNGKVEMGLCDPDMTERFYYRDSFLYEFDAEVLDVLPARTLIPVSPLF